MVPLCALVGGILLERVAPFQPREAAAILVVLTLVSLLAWRKGAGPTLWLSTIAAVAAAGITTSALHHETPAPELDVEDQEVVILEGCVVEPPVFSERQERFTLELAADARARVTLSLKPGQTGPALRYGQRAEVEARVRKPRTFRNPGAFDYEHYLARRKVYWMASVPSGRRPRVLPGRCGNRLAEYIFGLRGAALERIERMYAGDAYTTAMMEAVLLGETSKMEKVWTEHFRRTGTYHALVISGLHITVLAGVLLFLMRVAALRDLWALSLTALAAWLYTLVSGGSAPVVRAAGGFTLYLAARFCYRRTRVLNLLAAVAMVFLMWDPSQLYEASFQLSFLGVAAIGALAAPLVEHTSEPHLAAIRGLTRPTQGEQLPARAARFRVELRLLAETAALAARVPQRAVLMAMAPLLRAVFWVWEMLVLSLVMQFALALPMAVYFHRISFSGLTANLLVTPLMSAAVPVGFAAVLTGWRWPAWTAKLLVDWAAAAAAWHVRLEPWWRIPDPPGWLAAAFVAALVSVGVLACAKSRWWIAPGLALAAAFALLLWHPFPQEVAAGKLEVTAIDVGHGDSLLVVTPEGRRLLVDMGGFPTFGRGRARLDTGEDVITPYLLGRGIRRLDAAAVSHAEMDHMGGLGAVMENFRPAQLWLGRDGEGNGWDRMMAKAAALGVHVIRRRSGEVFMWGGVRVEVLSPTPEAPSRKANDDCLAMRISLGQHSFLLAGDLEREGEARLVREGRLRKTDVLKVAHHGSRTSSAEWFLGEVRPSMALISAGEGNPFRHPHGEVTGRLEAIPAAVLRTDRLGLITLRTDGRRYEMDAAAWKGNHRWLEPAF